MADPKWGQRINPARPTCPRTSTTPTQQAITADTTIAKLAALWLKYLRDEDRIEATTINEYERVLNKVVIPELGASDCER